MRYSHLPCTLQYGKGTFPGLASPGPYLLRHMR